jgi:hypothetical protein
MNTATTSGADVHGTGGNRQEGGGSHVQNRNERNERGGMTRPDNTQTHPDDERDLGTYTSTWNGTSGTFKICNHGVRFESKGKTHWEVPFERLGRVEKVRNPLVTDSSLKLHIHDLLLLVRFGWVAGWEWMLALQPLLELGPFAFWLPRFFCRYSTTHQHPCYTC